MNAISLSALRATLVATVLSSTALAQSSAPGYAGCSAGAGDRSPEQVIQDHLAALATGDLDAIMCDYALEAVVVMPGTVFTGRDEIRAGLAGMQALFGATQPKVTSMTVGGGAVISTWQLETEHVVVDDGADTFIVRGGRIQYQTVHAPLRFR